MQTNAAIAFGPIGAPEGHRRAIHTTRIEQLGDGLSLMRHVLECECGRKFGSRAQLAAHHNLAAMGVR